jgi:ribosome-binding factor A
MPPKSASLTDPAGAGRRERSHAPPARAANPRRQRVAEALRHALDRVLRSGQCRDPVLREASITVAEVRLSPDLRNATAYVMPLGGANAAAIIAALTRSAGFVRGLAARDLNLRYAPNLVFELDRTFDQAAHIAALLARPEVERDLRASPAGGGADADEG